jgi:ABC-2 type transport system permease protein
LLDAFTASGYFDLTSEAQSFEEVEDAIQSGRVAVGIIVPPDFAAIRNRGLPAPVQVLVDASDSMSSASAISAAQMLGWCSAPPGHPSASEGNTAAQPLYDVRIRPWYNPIWFPPTTWFLVSWEPSSP